MLIPEPPTPREEPSPAVPGSSEEPRPMPRDRSSRPSRRRSTADRAVRRRRSAGRPPAPRHRQVAVAPARRVRRHILARGSHRRGRDGCGLSRSRHQARSPGRAQALASRSGQRHGSRPAVLPGGAIGRAARSREYRAGLQHRSGRAFPLHRLRVHRRCDGPAAGRDRPAPCRSTRPSTSRSRSRTRWCTLPSAGSFTAISSPRISSSLRPGGPSWSTWGWRVDSSETAIFGVMLGPPNVHRHPRTITCGLVFRRREPMMVIACVHGRLGR